MTTTALPDEFTIPLDVALADLQGETKRINEANGWHEGERRLAAGISLLHSEISEALEAYRDHGLEDVTRDACGKCHCFEHPEGLESNGGGTCGPHLCKPEGVGSELADVLIRLLDETERMGFVPVRSIMAKFMPVDGEAFEDLLAVLHEDASRLLRSAPRGAAAIMLGHLCDLADRFGFDLLAETQRKLAFNVTRGFRHGGKRV